MITPRVIRRRYDNTTAKRTQTRAVCGATATYTGVPPSWFSLMRTVDETTALGYGMVCSADCLRRAVEEISRG